MYCDMPFSRLHVYVNGEATLCYGQTWTSRGVGNVLTTDPMEIWRGKDAAEFRQSIVDGSFRYCTDCRCPEMIELRDPPVNFDLDSIGCLVLSYDYRCNLSCPSCRTTNQKPSPLSSTIHQRLMESQILKHVKMISVMGSGEALFSPFFWDLIARLKTIECHPDLCLSLTTNGTLLTSRNLDKIRASGKKIHNVEISVDAACETTYSINRRGGDWHTLMANIANIVACGIPLRLNFVVQSNNFREMPRFVDMCFDLGAEYVRFDALNNWGSFTREEYLERAVHFPSHPAHSELKEVLKNPTLADKRVHMAQLSEDFFSTLSSLRTMHTIAAGHYNKKSTT